MSDLVYAPCEHGETSQHVMPCDCGHIQRGVSCTALHYCHGRLLGTVEEIERALSVAAAYDNAERIEWEHAGDWHRLVPETGDTE